MISGWRPHRPGPGPRPELPPDRDDDEPQIDDARLLGLQRLWRKTGNPLHCWRAIHLCLNGRPPLALPPWCEAYLGAVAKELTASMLGADVPRSSEVLAAFGLSRRGYNAFVDAKRRSEDMRDVMTLTQGRAAAQIASRRRAVTLRQLKAIIAAARDLIGVRGRPGRPRK